MFEYNRSVFVLKIPQYLSKLWRYYMMPQILDLYALPTL